MSKKLITSIIISISLLVSACSLHKPYLAEPVVGAQTRLEKPLQVQAQGISNEQMNLFFTRVLNIDQEALLALNQRPKELSDAYWAAYRNYQNKVEDMLGHSLAPSAQRKLDKQYLHDDFHFFRFIQLNDYMITGISSVIDAQIRSIREKADSNIYEVRVLAKAHVVDLDWARQTYQWDEEKGYYVQRAFLDPVIGPGQEAGQDQIRLALDYYLEVEKGDDLAVRSLKEKTGLHFGPDEKGHMSNNHFVTRLPFLDQPRPKDEEVIKAFLQAFLSEDYHFYSYYKKAHQGAFDSFRLVLEQDLGLKKLVKLREETYKHQFEPWIIPLKDNMESLYFDIDQDLAITPHVSSSAKLSTYQVDLDAKVQLTNGPVLPYQYSYLFMLDEDQQITSVRLIKQQEVGPEDLDLQDEAE